MRYHLTMALMLLSATAWPDQSDEQMRRFLWEGNRAAAESRLKYAAEDKLVEILGHPRNYAEEESLANQALLQAIAINGLEHPDVAKSLNHLAWLYQRQGKWDLAEPLYKRTLAMAEKAVGPDHPTTVARLSNLALNYFDQGKYDDAEQLCKRMLAIEEKAFGPDHPDTVESLNKLAVTYSRRGNYDDAEQLYKRALAIREKAVGPDHPDTARSLSNLAFLYYLQGKKDLAEPLYERAFPILNAALGADHPDTVAALRTWNMLDKVGTREEEAGREAQARQTLMKQAREAGAQACQNAIRVNRWVVARVAIANVEREAKRAAAKSDFADDEQAKTEFITAFREWFVAQGGR